MGSRAERQWRPIETAPREGTEVMLWLGDRVVVGAWKCELASYHRVGWQDGAMTWKSKSVRREEGWHHGLVVVTPTHWMPRPAGPEVET
jgi:hypothetical protein